MEDVIRNLWKKLLKLPSEDVCRRTLTSFDDSGIYIVKFMNIDYHVNLNEKKIRNSSDDLSTDNPEFYLLILSYLLQIQEISITNRWISEKSMKGGSLFFQGVHQLPSRSLIKLYGNNELLFQKAGIIFGGKERDYGDIAFEFKILPKIPLICVLWLEDEEFPARISYLFDSSIEVHFNLDLILALVNQFSIKMKNFENN